MVAAMSPILHFVRYVGRFRRQALLTAGCLVSTAILGLVTPRLIQQVIDRALSLGSPSILGLYTMGVVLIAIVNGVLAFAQRYSMATVVQGAVYEIRNDLYDHIIRLSFSFHDRSRTGQLISRMTGDIDQIAMFLGFGLSGLIGMSLTLVGAAIMLFQISWQLGLLGVLLIPPMSAVALSGSARLGPKFYLLRQQYGRMTSQIQESFAGVRVIKAFAREEHEIAKLRRELLEFLRQRMSIIVIFSSFMPAMGFLTNLGLVLVLGYGGLAVIGGRISMGELVAAQGYLMMLVGPVRMIGWMVVMARRATAASQRIFEILNTQPDVVEAAEAISLPLVHGEVRFEHVSFSYQEGANVLDDIDLLAAPGETVALLGATGSGKTSIINLVPRFYDVTKGRVLIDGVDVRDVTLKSLRSRIGTIFQEAVLFSGTIAENIAYGRSDASMDDIMRAAKAAQAHDFVMSFQDGYDTVVGERGVTLSGGQRQRVTIARALLLDAPILIMDDSTSSVDVETEYLIQRALNEAMRERTCFVIAHRLSTVKNADHIIVLDGGHVVEEGTHRELLETDGYYRRIYETQFAEQEEGQ